MLQAAHGCCRKWSLRNEQNVRLCLEFGQVKRFGIEIEWVGDLGAVITALRAEGLNTVDARHTHNTGIAPSGWAVKRDGSVQRGGELVSPPLDFDDPDQRMQVTRAVECLQRAGATTDPSAGIHVHVEAKNFDGSDFTGRQLAAVVRFTYKFEDAIYRIASSGWESIRPGARSYAKPIPEATAQAIMKAHTIDEVQRVWNGMALGGQRRRRGGVTTTTYGRRVTEEQSRYTATNLVSYWTRGTVEFRYANSSVNPVRIQTYIAFFMAIMDDARHGFSRSVKKSYRLGSMLDGTVSEKAMFMRLQQIFRTDSRDSKVLMSTEDWKNLRKLCWGSSSVPQSNIFGGW